MLYPLPAAGAGDRLQRLCLDPGTQQVGERQHSITRLSPSPLELDDVERAMQETGMLDLRPLIPDRSPGVQ